MSHSGCFSLGANLDFQDSRQNKYTFNIDPLALRSLHLALRSLHLALISLHLALISLH